VFVKSTPFNFILVAMVSGSKSLDRSAGTKMPSSDEKQAVSLGNRCPAGGILIPVGGIVVQNIYDLT